MLALERQPQAFRLEYKETVPEQKLREDIAFYLGEYRFKLPKNTFRLAFDKGLRDPITWELMTDITRKGFKERGTHREASDDRAALSLDEQLNAAPDGIHTILSASPPPDPIEPGYGTHGFINFGKVRKEKKRIFIGPMTAVRVEGLDLNGSNEFLSRVTGWRVENPTVDDLLASPILLQREVSSGEVDQLLAEIFFFADNLQIKERAQIALTKLKPWIDRFVAAVKTGTLENRQKIFNVIENLSIKYMNEDSGFIYMDKARDSSEIIKIYGQKVEAVPGSCPPNLVSNNAIGPKYDSINSALGGEEQVGVMECVKCPFCGETVNAILTKTKIICPNEKCKRVADRKLN